MPILHEETKKTQKNLFFQLVANTLKLIAFNLKDILVAVILSFCIASMNSSWADTITGKVIHIADGDTITILTIQKVRVIIRLAFIDAPEHKQPFNHQSKQFLRALIYGKTVSVTTHDSDDWGRIIGTVYLKHKDINHTIIQSGLAWHYKKYAQSQTKVERLSYDHSEKTARRLKKGLWSSSEAIPPWKWRHDRSK